MSCDIYCPLITVLEELCLQLDNRSIIAMCLLNHQFYNEMKVVETSQSYWKKRLEKELNLITIPTDFGNISFKVNSWRDVYRIINDIRNDRSDYIRQLIRREFDLAFDDYRNSTLFSVMKYRRLIIIITKYMLSILNEKSLKDIPVKNILTTLFPISPLLSELDLDSVFVDKIIETLSDIHKIINLDKSDIPLYVKLTKTEYPFITMIGSLLLHNNIPALSNLLHQVSERNDSIMTELLINDQRINFDCRLLMSVICASGNSLITNFNKQFKLDTKNDKYYMTNDGKHITETIIKNRINVIELLLRDHRINIESVNQHISDTLKQMDGLFVENTANLFTIAICSKNISALKILLNDKRIDPSEHNNKALSISIEKKEY
jgi:hypothetical protein